MKSIKAFLLSLSVIIFITSCDNDEGYSLNDMWLTTGTVMKTSDYFYIQTDDGNNLWPSASNVDPELLEDGLRVMVNYTVLGDANDNPSYDYYVKIHGMDDILTKPIFNFTEQTSDVVKDSIGSDPVYIKSTWFTYDYFNVEFEFGGGGYEVHFINMVKDLEYPETENGAVILELKHNKNGDPYNYKQWGIASFDVSELQGESMDSVNILVRSMNGNGEYEYNKLVTYHYGPHPELYEDVFNINRRKSPETKIK